jgi:hypothetical protein
MNTVLCPRKASMRPYGAPRFGWNGLQGFRYALPWAIFSSSLQVDCDRSSVSEANGISWSNRRCSCNCPGTPKAGNPAQVPRAYNWNETQSTLPDVRGLLMSWRRVLVEGGFFGAVS